MIESVFTWKLPKRWPRGERPNAHQLSLGAGLSYPVAVRVLANEPMARVDSATLGKLARYFGVKQPLTLLDYQAEPND